MIHSEELFAKVERAIRSTARAPIGDRIAPEDGLLDDLGFDSMTLATLAVALEDELDCAILLDGWVAESGGPSGLTVGSLCAYLEHTLEPA